MPKLCFYFFYVLSFFIFTIIVSEQNLLEEKKLKKQFRHENTASLTYFYGNLNKKLTNFSCYICHTKRHASILMHIQEDIANLFFPKMTP